MNAKNGLSPYSFASALEAARTIFFPSTSFSSFISVPIDIKSG